MAAAAGPLVRRTHPTVSLGCFLLATDYWQLTTDNMKTTDCRGFGLLEVLVATALMGLVLVVLLQVLTGAIRAQETTIEHARALQVADRVLQEACSSMNLSSNQYQGQDGTYRYLVRVTPQYEVTLPAALDRTLKCSLIQVTVSWQERGREYSLFLETIRSAAQRK
jgi:prepilin-type N-terminal cleavage/methylation domain-containing protein